MCCWFGYIFSTFPIVVRQAAYRIFCPWQAGISEQAFAPQMVVPVSLLVAVDWVMKFKALPNLHLHPEHTTMQCRTCLWPSSTTVRISYYSTLSHPTCCILPWQRRAWKRRAQETKWHNGVVCSSWWESPWGLSRELVSTSWACQLQYKARLDLTRSTKSLRNFWAIFMVEQQKRPVNLCLKHTIPHLPTVGQWVYLLNTATRRCTFSTVCTREMVSLGNTRAYLSSIWPLDNNLSLQEL